MANHQLKEFQKQLKEYKEYVGGRAGVSKASGFIMRMMAENKKKHSGQYRKPTTLPDGSKMSAPAIFEWKKLASPGQGGENERGNPYGASPFITKHFRGEYVPFSARPYEPETREQRVARYRFTARRLEKLARELAGDSPTEALPGLPRPPPPPPPPPSPERLPSPLEGLEVRRLPQEESKEPEAPPPQRERITLTQQDREEFRAQRGLPAPIDRDKKGKLDLPEDIGEVELNIDTEEYDNRDNFILDYLTENPDATIQQISEHLKEMLRDALRDEPEYPKFGTALASIHEPVRKVKLDMLEAYNHSKRMSERFDTILAQPGVSDKLKKLQEFLRRRGTRKGQEKARQAEWKSERIREKWRDLIPEALVAPLKEEVRKDIQNLWAFFRVDGRMKAFYHYLRTMSSNRGVGGWTSYGRASNELRKAWTRFADIRLSEKWRPILKEITKKFPQIDPDIFDMEKILIDKQLPSLDDLVKNFDGKSVGDYGANPTTSLLKDSDKVSEEDAQKASDLLESSLEDTETYVNPLLEELEVDEEGEEEVEARPTPKPPAPAPTAPAKKKTREERLVEIATEKPNKTYMDWSAQLKSEGYDGVSPSNLSILIKKLKEKGVWKLTEWGKAYAEKRKPTGGAKSLEITQEDLIGD